MMVIAYFKESNANEPLKIERSIDNHTTSNGHVPSAYGSETHSNPPDVVMDCRNTIVPKKTFLEEFVECFSLRKNFQILVSTQKPQNAVPIIDGIK